MVVLVKIILCFKGCFILFIFCCYFNIGFIGNCLIFNWGNFFFNNFEINFFFGYSVLELVGKFKNNIY